MAESARNGAIECDVVDMQIVDCEDNEESDFICDVPTQNRFSERRGGRGSEWKQVRKPKRKKVSSSTGSTDIIDTRTFDELSDSKQRSRLFELVSRNHDMLNDMRTEQRRHFQITEELQTSVVRLSERANTVERVVDQQSECLKMLAYHSIDTEARSRRNNIILYGITERVRINVDQLVLNFLEDELDIETSHIVIDRAHRLGSRSNTQSRSNEDQKRPIIVRFRDYADTEFIMKRAYKLKGTPFGIDRDYPKEIATARKQLYTSSETREARYHRKKVQILYPAKLIIDGQLKDDRFPEWKKYMGQDRMMMVNLDKVRDESHQTIGTASLNDEDAPISAESEGESSSDSESVFNIYRSEEDEIPESNKHSYTLTDRHAHSETTQGTCDTRDRVAIKNLPENPTRRYKTKGRRSKQAKSLTNNNPPKSNAQKTIRTQNVRSATRCNSSVKRAINSDPVRAKNSTAEFQHANTTRL